MQQDQSTTRDETTLESSTTVNVSRTVRDGPMGYGPHATSGDRDPESHIFRGED
ncbi:hypothetical protein [Streptomyces spirodelae]|uniref:Uncharacterized protein n=1 Tax=Streptomyces spirodelae TaxID=2812904 RepID=A0ABS3WR41_9ACTN|nr:hypothetical protein [Streptomyces spirodelae]MBO8185590.1 hypothetical protein [Streptomyces spirodelae]